MAETVIEEVKELLRSRTTFGLCDSVSLRHEKFVNVDLADKDWKKTQINAVILLYNSKKNSDLRLPKPLVEDPRFSFVATLKGRLIVNQSGGLPENAGLCLHPHFDYPYIPGSAVKGVARHAAWCEWDELSEGEEKERCAEKIVAVFGFPTGDDGDEDHEGLDQYLERIYKKREGADKSRPRTSGTICFLAANPETRPELVLDVLTCHHREYYKGESKDVALDNETPVPVSFPAVEKDVKFRFTLIPLRNRGEAYFDAAKDWLVKAITMYGVGAKTAAGYGWW